MKREFTFKKSIIGINILVLIAFIALNVAFFEEALGSDSVFNILFLVGMLGGWIAMTASSILKRLTIDEHNIQLRRLLATESVKVSDIASFKRFSDENNSGIILLSATDKELLKISSHFAKQAEIEYILSAMLRDLDREEYQESLGKVLENNVFGRTKEERVDNLQNAIKATRILNFLSIITGIGIVFFDNWNFIFLFWSCVLVLLIHLPVIYWFRGLIGLYPDNKAKPSAFMVVLLGFGVCLRAVLDIDLLDYDFSFWMTISVPALLLGLLFYWPSGSSKGVFHNVLDFFGIAVLLMPFSFGILTISNVLLDTPEVVEQLIEVKGKCESKSDPPDYYIKAEIPSHAAGIRELKISKRLYNETKIGDSVPILIKNGAWKMTYYHIGN